MLLIEVELAKYLQIFTQHLLSKSENEGFATKLAVRNSP